MSLSSYGPHANRHAVLGLAAVGFIVIMLLGLWLASYSTQYVPAVVGGAGMAAASLSSALDSSITPTLSAVPGPIGTTLYWVALIGWAVVLAYLVLFGILPFAHRSIHSFKERVAAAPPRVVDPLTRARASEVPLPVVKEEPIEEPVPDVAHHYSSYDGFKSFANGGALSIDDIVKGLSRERTERATRYIAEPNETVVTFPSAPESTSGEVRESVVAIAGDSRDFVAALIAGDRAAVFAGLREHVRSGGAPELLVSSTVCLIDDAYRARTDGSPCDASLERLVARLDTLTLEKLAGALVTAVDSSYTDSVTGTKLAFIRALSVLGA